MADIDKAKAELQRACKLYCEWIAAGKPDEIHQSTIEWELVMSCRVALDALGESESGDDALEADEKRHPFDYDGFRIA